MTLRIGVDLGGTKIEALALDGDGAELERVRVPTPRDYGQTLSAIRGLVDRLESAVGSGSVGVGIPGCLSPSTGLVKNANSTWLIGQPIDTDLSDALGRPVRVANDANCFALSEAVDGAGSDAEVVFGVILGTGVGGGLVIRRRVIEGAMRVAGEWGHNPLPWQRDDERPGPACYCGLHGCVETFLSGPGMKTDHLAANGRDWRTERIAEAATSGDGLALAALERYVDRLARGLATVVNVVDPDVIVLGGGMSNLPGLAESVQGALEPWLFTDVVATRVRTNVHGDSGGVRGAAWLWGPDEG